MNQQTPTVNAPGTQQQAGAPDSNSQRDGQGRFKAGNRGGPGNPFARQTAALRKALVDAVSEKDIADIAAALLDKARQGDVAAAKLVFSYALGKPTPAADPDALDQHEVQMLIGNHVDGTPLMQSLAQGWPIDMLLAYWNALLPFLHQAKAGAWLDLMNKADERRQRRAEEEAEAAEVDETEEAAATEPVSLEQRRRDWEEEFKALKARLQAVLPAAAATSLPGASVGAEPTQPVGTGYSSVPPRENGRAGPSRNGAIGAAPGGNAGGGPQ